MRYFLPLLLVTSFAWAQSLSTDKVSTFIDSLDPVTRYAERLDEDVRDGLEVSNILPEPGEPLRPYTRSLEYIREAHGDVYAAMGDIVDDHGFANLEEWADTGDRVMVAWLALQMEGTEIGAVSPEMLDQVPAQMRPQIERMLAMMEAVRNAPPGDIEVVRPLAGRLMDYMNAQGGQQF